MEIDKTKEDLGLGWVHVYGQYSYHRPVRIRGNRVALQKLKAAVEQALVEGKADCKDVFASDGEGYTVEISMSSTIAGIGQPEYIDSFEQEMEDRVREAFQAGAGWAGHMDKNAAVSASYVYEQKSRERNRE